MIMALKAHSSQLSHHNNFGFIYLYCVHTVHIGNKANEWNLTRVEDIRENVQWNRKFQQGLQGFYHLPKIGG